MHEIFVGLVAPIAIICVGLSLPNLLLIGLDDYLNKESEQAGGLPADLVTTAEWARRTKFALFGSAYTCLILFAVLFIYDGEHKVSFAIGIVSFLISTMFAAYIALVAKFKYKLVVDVIG